MFSGQQVNQNGKRSREPDEKTQDQESSLSLPSRSSSADQQDPESVKIIRQDFNDGETVSSPAMHCSLPGHQKTLSFASYEDYEIHYSKSHLNRCNECRKNFPTTHFLNLHIEENHDALFAVRRDRGDKMYTCFVEDCDRKCSSPQKRRMHLVDKHMFPKDYDFYIVNDGIDHRNSMLRSLRHRRKSSAAKHSMRERQDSENVPSRTEPLENVGILTTQAEQEDMTGLSEAMSSLKFIPTSVRFGRGGGRGRLSRS